jgi:hypothetical protein
VSPGWRLICIQSEGIWQDGTDVALADGEAVGLSEAVGTAVADGLGVGDGVAVAVGVLVITVGELNKVGVGVCEAGRVGSSVQVNTEDNEIRGPFSIRARERLPKRMATETRAARRPIPTWRRLLIGLFLFGFHLSDRQ